MRHVLLSCYVINLQNLHTKKNKQNQVYSTAGTRNRTVDFTTPAQIIRRAYLLLLLFIMVHHGK